MNTNSTANDSRIPRHSRWFEQRFQLSQVDDVGDGRNEDSFQIHSRPSTGRLRRIKGGLLRYNVERTPEGPVDMGRPEASDSDADIDDAVSEFAAGYYVPRFRGNRSSTMRPTTLKKLNLLYDAYQEQRTKASSPRGQSAPECSDGEVDKGSKRERSLVEQSLTEVPRQTAATETIPKQSTEPRKSVSSVAEATTPSADSPRNQNRSSTVGLWCLRQLMLVLLTLIEITLKLTIKVLEWLQENLQAILLHLWNQFMAPILCQQLPDRVQDVNAKAVILLIVVAPLAALLALCQSNCSKIPIHHGDIDNFPQVVISNCRRNFCHVQACSVSSTSSTGSNVQTSTIWEAVAVVRRQTSLDTTRLLSAIHSLVVLIHLLLRTTGVACEDVTLLLTPVVRSKNEANRGKCEYTLSSWATPQRTDYRDSLPFVNTNVILKKLRAEWTPSVGKH